MPPESGSFAARLLFALEQPLSYHGEATEEQRARWVANFLERSMGPDAGASVVPVRYSDGRWHVEIRVWEAADRLSRWSTLVGIPVHTVCPGEVSTLANPSERRTKEPLFRSVSPAEYADILASGRVVGRRNWFSGDRRDMVFFGQALDGVLGQGEDVSRYVASIPEVREELEAKEVLFREYHRLNDERREKYGVKGFHWGVPAAFERRVRQAEERAFKAQKKVFGDMDRRIKQVREQNRRDRATSYVLEMHGLPGGTLFTGDESFHTGPEVGFAPGTVGLDHLARVHVVLDGEVVRVLSREEALQLGPTPNAPRRMVRGVAAQPRTNPSDDFAMWVVRLVDTTSWDDIPGIGQIDEGVLTTYHVTDDPGRVLDALRRRVDLIAAYGQKGRWAELGPGLYFSSVPEYWVGRSADKWGFLRTVEGAGLARLLEALEARILDDAALHRLTETETEHALLVIARVRDGSYRPDQLLLVADQPYAIAFWKKSFLEPLGIEASPTPRMVEAKIVGTLAELKGSHPPTDLLRQLRRMGLVGVYTRGGWSTNPELVLWDSKAVISARELPLGTRRNPGLSPLYLLRTALH